MEHKIYDIYILSIQFSSVGCICNVVQISRSFAYYKTENYTQLSISPFC